LGRSLGRKKGAVSVEIDKGSLRLRWRVLGKRYYLSLGMTDTLLNRRMAEIKATKISLDIGSNNFDETLEKYRPKRQKTEVALRPVSVVDIYNQFLEAKAREVGKVTIGKYRSLIPNLDWFATRALSVASAEDFLDWLKPQNEPVTVKRKIDYLAQAYEWAIAKNIAIENPFKELSRRVKVPVKAGARPFSLDEVKLILIGFESKYPHYRNYVFFCLSTGMRLGEAINLQWSALSDECDRIEVIDTKRNKIRRFRLSEPVATMLRSHRLDDFKQNDYVFTTPNGHHMSRCNFRSRVWIPALESVGVDYRKPYTTRKTFISHALASGMNPMAIAELTGHDPDVLFDHYAAYIDSQPELPNLF
jgi:integrase